MPIVVKGVLSKDAVPGMVLPDAARWVAGESAFANEEGTPFSASLHEADPRLLLIVGENASGKSLAFRIIARILDEAGATPITLSIRERAGLGGDGMGNMRRAFMYGDERIQSTGATSARVVDSGFRNLDRPEPAALLMDEPEIFSHAREGCLTAMPRRWANSSDDPRQSSPNARAASAS